MSWAEVMKINSDFSNEPLNFNNYINDISVFGADSYVMKYENSNLFRMLIAQSLTLFGHDCIHEYIYDRLTEEDVDYMLVANGRLGQSFNSFYKTDVYSYGDIDAVLSTITPETYNGLELKFQESINRYISEKTKDDKAASWLLKVFPEVTQLANYTTMESILADTEFINNVLNTHLNLMTVICNSYMLTEYLGNKAENLVAYPFKYSTATINGIMFTDNTDGTITASAGTLTDATVATTFVLKDATDGLKLPTGNYELFGCPEGGDAEAGYSIVVTDTDSNVIAVDIGNGASFALERETQILVNIVLKSNLTTDVTFTPEVVGVAISLDDFNLLVETVATSSASTIKLIDQLKHNGKIRQFVTNLTAMEHVVTHAESMKTLLYDAETFALALAVPEVCEFIAASEVALQVIEEGCALYWANEAVMDGLKEKITAVADYLPTVPESAEAIVAVGKAVAAVEESVEVVNAVTSQSDKLAQGVDLWFNNANMMTALCANDASYQSIMANTTTYNKLISSTTAMRCALDSSDAHAIDWLTTRATVLFGSEATTQGLLGSTRAKNLIKNNTTYQNTFKSKLTTNYCGNYIKTYTFTGAYSKYDYYTITSSMIYLIKGYTQGKYSTKVRYGSDYSSASTTTLSPTGAFYYKNSNSFYGYSTTASSKGFFNGIYLVFDPYGTYDDNYSYYDVDSMTCTTAASITYIQF